MAKAKPISTKIELREPTREELDAVGPQPVMAELDPERINHRINAAQLEYDETGNVSPGITHNAGGKKKMNSTQPAAAPAPAPAPVSTPPAPAQAATRTPTLDKEFVSQIKWAYHHRGDPDAEQLFAELGYARKNPADPDAQSYLLHDDAARKEMVGAAPPAVQADKPDKRGALTKLLDAAKSGVQAAAGFAKSPRAVLGTAGGMVGGMAGPIGSGLGTMLGDLGGQLAGVDYGKALGGELDSMKRAAAGGVPYIAGQSAAPEFGRNMDPGGALAAGATAGVLHKGMGELGDTFRKAINPAAPPLATEIGVNPLSGLTSKTFAEAHKVAAEPTRPALLPPTGQSAVDASAFAAPDVVQKATSGRAALKGVIDRATAAAEESARIESARKALAGANEAFAAQHAPPSELNPNGGSLIAAERGAQEAAQNLLPPQVKTTPATPASITPRPSDPASITPGAKYPPRISRAAVDEVYPPPAAEPEPVPVAKPEPEAPLGDNPSFTRILKNPEKAKAKLDKFEQQKAARAAANPPEEPVPDAGHQPDFDTILEGVKPGGQDPTLIRPAKHYPPHIEAAQPERTTIVGPRLAPGNNPGRAKLAREIVNNPEGFDAAAMSPDFRAAHGDLTGELQQRSVLGDTARKARADLASMLTTEGEGPRLPPEALARDAEILGGHRDALGKARAASSVMGRGGWLEQKIYAAKKQLHDLSQLLGSAPESSDDLLRNNTIRAYELEAARRGMPSLDPAAYNEAVNGVSPTRLGRPPVRVIPPVVAEFLRRAAEGEK